jgi:hypothetical protein
MKAATTAMKGKKSSRRSLIEFLILDFRFVILPFDS